ncbi:hypothetical protein GCM10022627_25160 [Haloarcula argentinensis]
MANVYLYHEIIAHSNDLFNTMLRLFTQTQQEMMDDSLGRRMDDDSRHLIDASPGYRADQPAAGTHSGGHRRNGIYTTLHIDETDDGYAVMVGLPGFGRDGTHRYSRRLRTVWP